MLFQNTELSNLGQVRWTLEDSARVCDLGGLEGYRALSMSKGIA